ncbi:organic cation transporter protein-like [Branchiostoma lanceolatum]|uniref:organic cation transporter protein-like n=1 Tax=Branchiostoma lanceolatum TaxID=7740 RepID=UPI00345689CB
MVDFDESMKHIGSYGRFQRMTYFMCLLVGITTPWHQLGSTFLDAETDFHCAVPGAEGAGLPPNHTDCVLNYSLPIERTSSGTGWRYSDCTRYVVTSYELGNLTCPYPAHNRTTDHRPTQSCDNGYWYDTTQYKSSIFTEFGLVCDDYWLNSLSQSIYMCGVLIGAIGFGQLADFIGRKKTIFISLVLMIVFGTIVTFAPNYTVFVIARLLVGTTVSGIFLSAFVIGTELTGPDMRTWTATLPHVAFATGYMLYALMAWGIRSWRTLQLTMTIPTVCLLFSWPFLIESPRWLISVDRHDEAAAIVRRMAKFNGVTVPEDVLNDRNEKKKNDRRYTAIDLLRTRNLLLRNLNLFYQWFVTSMVFYGLSLNTSSLPGIDDYVAFFLGGFVEIPGLFSSYYLLDILGRPKCQCLYMTVGGIACIISPFLAPPYVPEHLAPLSITLAMLGKLSISACFNISYIMSAELNPTILRNVAVGAGSMWARIGGVVSPFVVYSKQLWLPLPFAIFGGCAILAGVVAIVLPETMGADLPETTEEAEHFGIKRKSVYLSDIEKHGEVYRNRAFREEDNPGDNIKDGD